MYAHFCQFFKYIEYYCLLAVLYKLILYLSKFFEYCLCELEDYRILNWSVLNINNLDIFKLINFRE